MTATDTAKSGAKKMKREYVVCDEEGSISWDVTKDVPERFKTFKAAKTRAHELADLAPGKTIRIYELTAETVAPVGPPDTARRHPLEHYK
jgi:hypothetical protein